MDTVTWLRAYGSIRVARNFVAFRLPELHAFPAQGWVSDPNRVPRRH